MKFAIIAHAIEKITSPNGGDRVTLELRNAGNPKPSGAALYITWTRLPKEDWKDPVLSLDDHSGTVSLDQISGVARLVRAFDRITDEEDLNDPDSLVVKMEKEGSRQFVYDPRIKKFVDVAKLKGEGQERYTAEGFEEISVSATTVEQAASRIAQEFVKLAGEKPELGEAMGKWFAKGRKVSKVAEGAIPKFEALGNYCKRGHQHAAAVLREKKSPDKKPKEERTEKDKK